MSKLIDYEEEQEYYYGKTINITKTQYEMIITLAYQLGINNAPITYLYEKMIPIFNDTTKIYEKD